MALYKAIIERIGDRQDVSPKRRDILLPVQHYLLHQKQKNQAIHLQFICTHNSRRSILCQVWATALAHHFDVPEFYAFSAGTETTEVYPTVLTILDRAGFHCVQHTKSSNPRYHIHYAAEVDPIVVYSKNIDQLPFPKRGFGAIMTCDHANEHCPVVPGAVARFPITYIDPKIYDGTKQEEQQYDKTMRQIVAEWYDILKVLKDE